MIRIGVLVLAAALLGGCGSSPKVGDAPNTGQAVKAEDLPPELKARMEARQKVFGKPGPMREGGPSARPGP